MNEHDDLERTLQSFAHDPAPAIRRTVLAACVRPAAAPFWRRPVPLYAVAALLVLAVSLSLAVSRGGRAALPAGAPAIGPTADGPAAATLPWATAVCDQI